MKKISALLLTALLLSSFSAAYASGPIELPDIPIPYDNVLKGDVNKDGLVDNKDVVSLFRVVSAGADIPYSSEYDANDDGKVNNKDVTVLFRKVSE